MALNPGLRFLLHTTNQSSIAMFDIGPKLIPQSATDEVTVDCAIQELYVMNAGPGTTRLLIQDKQTPPVTLIDIAALPVGGMVSMNSMGRSMPGGITWSSSGTGVTGSIAGYRSAP